MYQHVISYFFRAASFLFLISILGCTTPKMVTKTYDHTYQNRITEIQVLLVRGNFPGAEVPVHNAGLDNLNWYTEFGDRVEKNFRHNGLSITTTIVPNSESIPFNLNTRSKDVPTLLLFPDLVVTQFNRDVVRLRMEAKLFAPNQPKPVWEAASVVTLYQAADETSLKILNELWNLKLIALSHEPAETVNGLKSISHQGLLFH